MKKFIMTGVLFFAVSVTAVPVYAAGPIQPHHGHAYSSGYCYEDADRDGVCDYYYDDDNDGYCDHCANQNDTSSTQCGGHRGHGHGRHHG